MAKKNKTGVMTSGYKLLIPRKDRRCADCNYEVYAYSDIMYKKSASYICDQCYFMKYASPEEIADNNKIIDQLPF